MATPYTCTCRINLASTSETSWQTSFISIPSTVGVPSCQHTLANEKLRKSSVKKYYQHCKQLLMHHQQCCSLQEYSKLTNSGGLRDVSINHVKAPFILMQLNASTQSQFGKDGLQPQIQYTKSYSRYTVCVVQAVSEGRPTSNPDPTKPTALLMKLEQLALRVSVVVCRSTYFSIADSQVF